MKKFVFENWYKLMIGSSLLMVSFGFMIHSISPTMAGSKAEESNFYSDYRLVPINADGSINVKISDEQLDKIVPKNKDGSINVRMAPGEIINVNLEKIGNKPVGSQIVKDEREEFAILKVKIN